MILVESQNMLTDTLKMAEVEVTHVKEPGIESQTVPQLSHKLKEDVQDIFINPDLNLYHVDGHDAYSQVLPNMTTYDPPQLDHSILIKADDWIVPVSQLMVERPVAKDEILCDEWGNFKSGPTCEEDVKWLPLMSKYDNAPTTPGNFILFL